MAGQITGVNPDGSPYTPPRQSGSGFNSVYRLTSQEQQQLARAGSQPAIERLLTSWGIPPRIKGGFWKGGYEVSYDPARGTIKYKQEPTDWRKVALGAGIGAAAGFGAAQIGGAVAGGAGSAGGGAGSAAAGGGLLASTPTATGLAAYPAAATSALGGGGLAAGGTAAGVGGTALLAGTPTATGLSAYPAAASSGLGAGGTALGTTAAAGGSASILDRIKRWAGAAGDVGGVFAGAGEGAADERDRENRYNDSQDRARASIYGTEQGAALDAKGGRSREQLGFADTDLKRREFALNAPSARARQAVLGSGLANTQDATITGGLPDRIKVPTISGGARPSNLDGNTRALGSRLTADALAGQLKGDNFDPLTPTDFDSALKKPPELSPYQQAGGLESGLSGGGTAASIVQAILAQLGRQSTERSGLVR